MLTSMTEVKKMKKMEDPSLESNPNNEVVHPDRISNLPECILTSILSLLPSIQARARTGILSSRWRNLWAVSSLEIDTHYLVRETLTEEGKVRSRSREEDSWCINVLDAIISRHSGPILSLRLSNRLSDRLQIPPHRYRKWDLLHVPKENWVPFRETLNRWIETLDRKGVQNLTLHYELPPSAATCQSLRCIELRQADLRGRSPMMPPNLRELRLYQVNITDRSLSQILSDCRFLDTLVLDACMYREILHIMSPGLRKLKMYGSIGTPVWIEDAPNLELLILADDFTYLVPLKVINAPMLTRQGIVGASPRMHQFGETCFQHDLPINSSTRVHSLKTLITRVDLRDDREAQALACFLRCFPCLETLVVLSVGHPEWSELYFPSKKKTNPQYWEQEGSSDCLDNHLTSVKIKGFVGDYYDLNFVKFLMQNGQVLKTMSLLYSSSYMRKELKEAELRELVLENKASSYAQLIFMKDKWECLFD